MVIDVRRRHRMEIVAEILRNAVGGIQKTQLVYLTNINFTLLKKYQNILADKGLIESMNGQIYTTEEGIEFLRKYKELMNIWTNFEIQSPATYIERKAVFELADQK
jgi:predicted transcriptional regulator